MYSAKNGVSTLMTSKLANNAGPRVCDERVHIHKGLFIMLTMTSLSLVVNAWSVAMLTRWTSSWLSFRSSKPFLLNRQRLLTRQMITSFLSSFRTMALQATLFPSRQPRMLSHLLLQPHALPAQVLMISNKMRKRFSASSWNLLKLRTRFLALIKNCPSLVL